MFVEDKEIRFDYSKLRGRIVEKYGSISTFCKDTGRDRSTINNKLLTGSGMRQDAIITIAQDLAIPETEYNLYFFTPLVEKSKLDEKS